MKIEQFSLKLSPYTKGMHLITKQIEKLIPPFKVGVANIFIKHTSASLCINENADFSVRVDAQNFFSDLIDSYPNFTHTLEGADDMPAHIKNMIFGSSLNIPITNGKLNLGTWQGIYLCEHRDFGGSREIIVTVYGE